MQHLSVSNTINQQSSPNKQNTKYKTQSSTNNQPQPKQANHNKEFINNYYIRSTTYTKQTIKQQTTVLTQPKTKVITKSNHAKQ